MCRIVGPHAPTDTSGMDPSSEDPRTPVTLLTGWLGAGKTTLVNRILSEPHGQKFAVLVNEFGDIGIDDRLVVRSKDQMVELQNGCVCCTVRGDLIQSLKRLRKRRPPFFKKPTFDRVLIETTGIAEPAPLLKTFLLEAEIATYYQVEAVIGMVDAKHHSIALNEPSAVEQIALADVLLLNKIDVSSISEIEQTRKRLRKLNPTAPIFNATRAAVSIAEILQSRPPRSLQKISDAHRTEEKPHDGIATVSLLETRPLDEMKVQLWLGACTNQFGLDLIRYKGFIHLADRPYRAILQGTYDLYQVSAGEEWKKDEPRNTELVFIGRNLEKDFFLRGIRACVAN